MLTRTLPSVAVIADAHFHDTAADFGFPGIEIDGQRITMRSWSDTRGSTRVFNESADALHAALEEVRQRGIRHVVLLGDYTDDGQRVTTETLKNILQSHSDAHGTAFYALPGNHDIFGPRGRHHTKEFLTENGKCLSVSSDARRAGERVVVNDGMYCEGYPAGLCPMAVFGYFRQPDYLHWETPFGVSDAPEGRLYAVCSPDGRNVYRLMDASYLVEPEPGLWLLMIDANIFEPLDGEFEAGEEAAFIDSTSGGGMRFCAANPSSSNGSLMCAAGRSCTARHCSAFRTIRRSTLSMAQVVRKAPCSVKPMSCGVRRARRWRMRCYRPGLPSISAGTCTWKA